MEGRQMMSDTIESTARPIWVPTGDLTIFEVDQFHHELVTLLEADGPIELDLSHIERVDGAGMQLITAASRCHRFRITKIPSGLSEMLATAGCHGLAAWKSNGG